MTVDLKHISPGFPSETGKPEKIIAEILLSFFQDKSSPVIAAVGGPGGTGKSTFCESLKNLLPDCDVLELDNYKKSRKERRELKVYGPHPDANRIDLIVEHLRILHSGGTIDSPVYNRVSGETDTTIRFSPRRFILLDGEISTYAQFRQYVDFSIFIDSDLKTQLCTRMSRDVQSRGSSRETAISTFLNSNIKEFTLYGAPSKSWADIHLYCNEDYSLQFETVLADKVLLDITPAQGVSQDQQMLIL